MAEIETFSSYNTSGQPGVIVAVRQSQMAVKKAEAV